MVKIGLDLAVRTVGIAVMDGNNILLKESYKSKEKNYDKLQIEMTDWVWGKISPYLVSEHKLIIENLYVGLDPTSSLDAAKVHGAVKDRYYTATKKFPTVIGAIGARKLANIPTRASKSEIQLAIIERLKLGEISLEVKGEIIRARNLYEQLKEKVRRERKTASPTLKKKLNSEQASGKRVMGNTMNRMSTQIRYQTCIDEHIADALVLVIGDEG